MVNKLKKFILGLVLALGVMSVPAPVLAQTTATGRIMVGPAASRPTLCKSGDIYEDSDDTQAFRCFPNNTWVVFGGGLNNPVTSPNPLLFNIDLGFGGPNPWLDVRSFGVTSVNGNAAPQIPGITVTISASSPTATLSSASTFVNGMGVVIQGAGATNTMSTPGAPTVTTGLARTGTHTGDMAPGATGATSYNYKVVAQGQGLGYTAASSAGTVTTGPSSLGYQTVNLSSCSRATNIVTCTTSSAHGLVVGAEIRVVNTSDISFNGEFNVLAVPDNTHFTWFGPLDARNEPSISATGGTVGYWQGNHVTWSAVTGAFRYFIYSDRANPGTYALIGVSQPVDGSFVEGTLFFDDFGAILMNGFNAPFSIPSTAPSSATNDSLVTTILSGAGTTTLTLANNAINSVGPGAVILSDHAPNIKAAAVSGNGAPLYFPYGLTFVTNSILDVSAQNPAFLISGSGTFRDSVIMGSSSSFNGTPLPVRSGAMSFTFESLPQVFLCGNPGLLMKGPIGDIKRLQISGCGGNGQTVVLTDGGGGGPGYQLDTLSIGSTSISDAMTIPWFARGLFAAAGAQYFADKINILTSQGVNTATPAQYTHGVSNNEIRSMFLSGRGIMLRTDSSGSAENIGWLYCQACISPLVSVAASKDSAGAPGFDLTINHWTNDSANPPIVSLLPLTGFSGVVLRLQVVEGVGSATIGYSGSPATSISGLSGQNFNTNTFTLGQAIENVFNPSSSGSFANNINYAALSTANSYPIFVDGPQVTNFTATPAAGGSVPNGNYIYTIYAVWQNGGDGRAVSSSQVTTTTGTNTVNLSWTALGGSAGCSGYRIARNGQLIGIGSFVAGCGSNSATDTAGFTAGPASTIPSGGPSIIMPNLQGIAAPKFIIPNGKKGTLLANALTVDRNWLLPDVPGTVGILSGSFSNADCLQASVSGGVISIVDTGTPCGSGGGGATFQVNGVNTSNQSIINFQNAAAFNGLTLSMSNPSAGNIQPVITGLLANSGLQNSSIAITTTAPLLGGTTVSLGGTLSLTCPNCAFGGVNSKIANYTLVGGDDGFNVVFNGSNLTATLPATPPSTSWKAIIQNLNATNLTVSRNGLNINGAASNITVPQFQYVIITTDGTNYFAPHVPVLPGTNITVTGASTGITVAATGTGVGGTGTINFIPKWSSASNLTNSAMDDGVTNAGKITSTEGIVAPNFTANGTCNSGTTGCITLGQGTAPSSFTANSFTLFAPTSIGTGYGWVVPSSVSTGIIHVTASGTTGTLTVGAIDLSSADVTNNLSFSKLSAGTLSNAGVFAMSTNTLDLTGTTLVKLRTASGLTTTVNGDIGYDTLNKNWHIFQNGVDSYQFGGPVSGTYNNGDCVQFGVTAGSITLQDTNTSCAGINVQTNSVANSLQTTLNLLNSAATNGITLTVTNTSAGNVQLGYTGTLNNSGLTNSSVTFNSTTVALGSSGNIPLNLIANPTNDTIFTLPSTKVLNISGTQPPSQSGAGINAGILFSTIATAGSATTGNATTAGTGSINTLASGPGGSASGGTNAIGGAGGSINFITGSGGASSGTAVNSNGGNVIMNLGMAGTGGSGTAGNNGSFQIVSLTGSAINSVASSPQIQIQGSYQNAATPTFALDQWSIQNVIGAGTNGTTTLTFSHTGTSGAATVLVPNLTDSALSAGNCVQAGTGGILTTVAGACAAGGSGTVNSGTTPRLAYYASSSTAVSDTGANLTWNTAGALTIGVNATATGQLILASGAGSGQSVTIQNRSTTSAYNFNLPSSPGTSGQILQSKGGGTNDQVYIDFPQIFYAPAADCVNSVAGSGWSTGATPAAFCRAGTNNKDAELSPWGASDVGYFKVHLPADWDSSAATDISIDLTSTDATNGHTIIMQAATACAKGDGTTTDDVAFNSPQSFSTITLNGNANRTWNATLTSATMTGCAVSSTLWIKISRTTDTATNVGVYGATVTVGRLLALQAN